MPSARTRPIDAGTATLTFIVCAAFLTLTVVCLASGLTACARKTAPQGMDGEATWTKIVHKSPLPVSPAPAAPALTLPPPVQREGETVKAFESRISAEAASAVRNAQTQAKALADARIAQIKAAAREEAETAKADARRDFLEQTRRWTGWAMGGIAAAGVLALVLSFFPFGTRLGFDFTDSVVAFAAVAALSLVRYVLLRYGLLIGDVLAYLLMGMVVASAVVVAWAVGKSAMRFSLLNRAQALLNKGETRAAVALEATAKNKTAENGADASWRRDRLAAVDSTIGGAA